MTWPLVARARRGIFLWKGMKIHGFGGEYLFTCNDPRRVLIDNSLVERGVHFQTAAGGMVALHRAWVGRNTVFNVIGHCEVREKAMIAANAYVCDFAHGMNRELSMIDQPLVRVGDRECLVIGPDSWIGASVVVIGAVEIGEGAVVGAGSVVRCSIPPFEIWAGVPARRVGSR